MTVNKLKWVSAIVILLALIAQLLINIPNVSAEEMKDGLDDDRLSAGLTDEEWRQVMQQVNPYLETYLKASNAAEDDCFGTSVAISGDTLVVGAYSENSGANDSGAAYVFVRSGSTWTQQAILKASNAEAEDYFGISVAISGDTIVVGANGEDSSGNQEDNSVSRAGAAYVFVRSGTTWNQQAYLKADNAGSFDQFGHSVSISGDTIAVGAPGEASNGSGPDDNSMVEAGAAYIFVRSGSTWSQQGYLKPNYPRGRDDFGYSIAVDGSVVVVGALEEDGDGTTEDNDGMDDSGAAYVFGWNGSKWTQQAYLKADNVGEGDEFGISVAIDGDSIAVGAHTEDGNGTDPDNDDAEGSGAAYVFTYNGSEWTQEAYLKASNLDVQDRFGTSVAISGNTVVVGAPHEDSNGSSAGDNSAQYAGASYVFENNGSAWLQSAYLKSSNIEQGDYFGWSVAVLNGVIVVGAIVESGDGSSPDDNSAEDAGAVYIFSQFVNSFIPLVVR